MFGRQEPSVSNIIHAEGLLSREVSLLAAEEKKGNRGEGGAPRLAEEQKLSTELTLPLRKYSLFCAALDSPSSSSIFPGDVCLCQRFSAFGGNFMPKEKQKESSYPWSKFCC